MPSTVSPATTAPSRPRRWPANPECGCTFANAAPNSCFGAFDREHFDLIDVFAAAVVALRRIAFGVFVRQHRALRLQHSRACVIFRRDQLDVIFLALLLIGNRLPQRIVVAGKLHFGIEHQDFRGG